MIKAFLSVNGKSSGIVYIVRQLVISLLFLLPTAIIIPSDTNSSNVSAEALSVIQFVFPVVIFLFLIQDFQRMNSLIPNKKVHNFLFLVLIISYLLNYLSLWDDKFSFTASGFFNWGSLLYLTFWNAKYDTEEEEKLATKIFTR